MQPDEVQQLVEHEYAQTSIRVKARQLSRRKDFGASSREDIEQDLWLHLLTHAAKFDGDRSSLNTFIDRMVNSGAAILVRSREREMRADGFHAQSLDANRSGGDSSQRSLRSTLSSTDGARRIGNDPLSDLAQLEDQEALTVAFNKMPPEVRRVCQRLMEGAKPWPLATELGISRRQVSNLLAEAKRYLEEAGFGDE
jgi:RNA polymerase sigma factor (sigma-70 family)